jgi:OmpA-OmpF porin, OOP family
MKVGFLAGATLAGVFAAASSSADPASSGWYGAVDLGGHARQDAQTPSQIPELGYKPASPRFHTTKDFAGFARVGYRLLPHLRFELEAGWRPAEMLQIVDEYQNGRPPGSITRVCGDAAMPADANCGAPAGRLESWTAMANAINDFWPLGRPEPRLHPFAGIGIGIAHVRLQTEGRLFGTSSPLSPPGSLVIDGADNRFAAQAFGGLTMRINHNWTADLTYRFLYSGPHRWNTMTSSNIKLGPITGKYEDHALTLGFRHEMSVAAPPPSPPPPPPPSKVTKESIANFPFGRHALTPDAPSVVQQGAQ